MATTTMSSAPGGHRKRSSVSSKLLQRWIMYCVAAFCIILSLAVILGGAAVLAIFLAYRPRGPRLDIPTATLNAAYLDSPGPSLNADLTFLANLSNPNRRIDLKFSYLQIDLYFQSTLIATQAVRPFAERRGESVLRNVDMLSSEVALPPDAANAWQNGTAPGGDGVSLRLMGKFRTRMVIGGWLRYTYWARVHCDLMVGPPPAGALLGRQC
uniref:Late embryogenesis abundant protein LEA-2 subgroup domain-containing protein n=1 Tax=Ananas comosus var. bracteatus TaxID=296719 RepID=A0A6V7Q850_ANACO|nr:unnamed protein product [Ananas comosus var. bracteatus]